MSTTALCIPLGTRGWASATFRPLCYWMCRRGGSKRRRFCLLLPALALDATESTTATALRSDTRLGRGKSSTRDRHLSQCIVTHTLHEALSPRLILIHRLERRTLLCGVGLCVGKLLQPFHAQIFLSLGILAVSNEETAWR